MTQEYYTVEEAAEILRCSKATILRGIKDGKIPSQQIREHGKQLIPRSYLFPKKQEGG